MKTTTKIIITFIVAFYIFSCPASSHPGRTDSNGGHYDRSTGEYHYHSGKYANRESSSSSFENSGSNKDIEKENDAVASSEPKITQKSTENYSKKVVKTESVSDKSKRKNHFTGRDFAFWLYILVVICIAIFCFYPLLGIFSDLFRNAINYIYKEKPERLGLKAYFLYRKNARRFIKDFSNLILEYENEAQKDYYSFTPSCCDEMKKLMLVRLSYSRAELSKLDFDKIDYKKMLHAHLSCVSFDLLASGSFHIYYGELDFTSCALNLKRIHNRAINYALENGYITEKEAEEDAKALRYSIRNVG